MIAGQEDLKALGDEVMKNEIGRAFFTAKDGGVDSAFGDRDGQLRRILTRDHDVRVGKFIAQDFQSCGQPGGFMAGEEAENKMLFCRSGQSARVRFRFRPGRAPCARDREKCDPQE
jgi:hypothetical protein